MTHWRENFANYHILHENFELLGGGASPLRVVVRVYVISSLLFIPDEFRIRPAPCQFLCWEDLNVKILFIRGFSFAQTWLNFALAR